MSENKVHSILKQVLELSRYASILDVRAGVKLAIEENEAQAKRIKELKQSLDQSRVRFGEIARRLHIREGHNQLFERCESAWCNPREGSGYLGDPALDSAKYREKERARLSDMVGQLNQRITELEAEVTELRKDKERLDAVLRHGWAIIDRKSFP